MSTGQQILPRAVINAVEGYIGNPIANITSTSGGFSHTVVCADVAPFGRVVIKAASDDEKRHEIRSEGSMLRLLGGAVQAPKIHAMVETDVWTVELVEFLPGINGLQFVQDVTTVKSMVCALAGALARVHRHFDNQMHGLDVVDAHFSPTSSFRRVALGLEAIPLRPDQRIALEFAARAVASSTYAPCLIHGDAGLHNILWSKAAGMCGLLDWEWSGLGNPQLDLAWLRWTLAWRALDTHWPDAFEAYTSAGGRATLPHAGALSSLVCAQIAMILVRSKANQAATHEWLRRLDWTLARALE